MTSNKDMTQVFHDARIAYAANTSATAEEYRTAIAEFDTMISMQQQQERFAVMQELREKSEFEPPQMDQYGRVEFDGYITVGLQELEDIEGNSGEDRVSMSLEEWEAFLESHLNMQELLTLLQKLVQQYGAAEETVENIPIHEVQKLVDKYTPRSTPES